MDGTASGDDEPILFSHAIEYRVAGRKLGEAP
jgi:hypothetical protein